METTFNYKHLKEYPGMERLLHHFENIPPLQVGGILLFKIFFLPSMSMLLWMSAAIVIDFITGVTKAFVKNEARTSEGFRQTVVKASQYLWAIAAGIVIANVGHGSENKEIQALLGYVNDGLVVFITYIEVTSIFENLTEIDNKSMISRYFFAPALKVLTIQFKKNALTEAADVVKPEVKDAKDSTNAD